MKLRHQIHNFFDFLAMTERIDRKIGGCIEGKLCMYFWSFKLHGCWQREVIFSQISHFMISDRIIRVTIRSVSSPNHVSGGTKRYVERKTSVYNTWTCLSSMVHITLHGFWTFYVRFWAFLSWFGAILILKKGVKLRYQIHKNLDFLIMTEQIDIKIGGYIHKNWWEHWKEATRVFRIV